jgi:AcrR family transcriptional regulator
MASEPSRTSAVGRPAFSPKRGRPTADQARAIGAAIIDAAIEVFLAEGFQDASMEAVAKLANVPKSTLYKRYPDKVSLLRAALGMHYAKLNEMGGDLYEALPADFERRLKLAAAGMLRMGTTPEVQAFARLSAIAWAVGRDSEASLQSIGYRRMVDFVEKDIREYGPTAGIHPSNPRRVAEALMTMLSGWFTTNGADAGITEASAAEFAETAVDLLLHGKDAW